MQYGGLCGLSNSGLSNNKFPLPLHAYPPGFWELNAWYRVQAALKFRYDHKSAIFHYTEVDDTYALVKRIDLLCPMTGIIGTADFFNNDSGFSHTNNIWIYHSTRFEKLDDDDAILTALRFIGS